VLSRIFRPKRDEVTGEWRKLHNEELNSVLLAHYYAGDEIEKNEMAGACSSCEGGKKRVKGFGGKT
jgi:quinolinate synthase